MSVCGSETADRVDNRPLFNPSAQLESLTSVKKEADFDELRSFKVFQLLFTFSSHFMSLCRTG